MGGKGKRDRGREGDIGGGKGILEEISLCRLSIVNVDLVAGNMSNAGLTVTLGCGVNNALLR